MSNEALSAEEIAQRRAYHAKLASIGVLKGGRTRDRVNEYRRSDGVRVKETTDELGNTVRQHATKDDRQDVIVRPQAVDMELKAV